MQPLDAHAVALADRQCPGRVRRLSAASSFWPTGLAVLYPHPGDSLPLWQVAVAALLLLAISAVAVVETEMPLPVGRLALVSGDAGAGDWVGPGRRAGDGRPLHVLAADRAVHCRGVGRGGVGRRSGGRWLPLAAAAVVVILAGVAWRQTGYWHDSVALWKQTLRCTSDNAVAQHNLGQALADRGDAGDLDEAIRHFSAAVGIIHDYADAHFGLGIALEKRGRLDEAINEYQVAVEIKPDFVRAENNLGVALAKRGRFDEAIAHYRRTLESDSANAEVHSDLAAALIKNGQTAEAMRHFAEAIRLKPQFAQGHFNFGLALARTGQTDAAIEQFQQRCGSSPTTPRPGRCSA